ncbi:MAG: 50S ribosomal protein L17 [Candidatus Krumholzibacteria bacterium]
MRHRVDHRKLGRTASHRKAMLANMVTSLFDKERITTTDAKAKEARRTAERLITRAKKGYAAYQEHQSLKEAGNEADARRMQAVALAHWRQASRVIKKQAVLKKLFDDIAPLYMEREGGYTRILRLGNRAGDNAKTVLLELVDTAITSQPKPARSRRKSEETEPKGKEAKEAKAEDTKAKGKKKKEMKAESQTKSKEAAEKKVPKARKADKSKDKK